MNNKQIEIMKLLFNDHDPYTEFKTDKYSVDLQGWNGNHPVFEKIIKEIKPELILELGSWKGQSATTIIKEAVKYYKDTVLICVDTWLGSSEHWDYNRENACFDSLKLINGYPSLYYQFLANIVINKLSENIIPFPQTTAAAYEVFKRLGLVFDMIYLDAGHDYESVLFELNKYWDILKPGGILIGDDITWVGVEKAVKEFSSVNSIPVEYDDCKYIIRK